MSCDTDYQIRVSAEKKESLEALLQYLQEKKDRLDAWQASGKTNEDLVKKLKAKTPADVITWGFSWKPIRKRKRFFYMEGTCFANQNSGNVSLSVADGELASISRAFPGLEWDVEWENEFGNSGSLCPPSFEMDY